MKEPDFEFWRAERQRILSAPFNEYREEIEPSNYLTAIDTILEVEPLLAFVRGNLLRVETIIEEFLAK